ncbi:hypothetical protein SAMN05421759_101639 [Roseivivax lentus]|uniref:Right handed beta helix region n=2 Tax=Roseivivax lentus TaxID=633194 RepID=A0A1N7KCP9_9RHOB|nr:hypothetical protein SAMN05421759_101639 [Roseivivax lentus]
MTFRSFAATSVLALTVYAGPAQAQAPILVTTTADSGAGSLRAALAEAAAMDAPAQIIVTAAGDIAIDETLDYPGTAPLSIFGNGNSVTTAADVTLFSASNGADLTLRALHFAGPGGWSIENRADADGSAGKGIFVDVRDDQTGLVSLVLHDVSVSGVANHGIHVSDCSLADECGGGSGGGGEGSPASILVHLSDVRVEDAGNGKFDADGLRVDERAEGSVTFIAHRSVFTGVGADGVELDEGQAGDVIVEVTASAFNDNGAYCDPDLLASALPDPDEAEYEEGEVAEADIPGPVTGTLDDGCIEREVDLYEDGSVEAYAFGIDLDDGFDVDEAGDGSIHLVMDGSEIARNLDEGLDFDEEGAGGIVVSIVRSTATGNNDDGYKMSEEDAGDVTGTVLGSSAIGNGGVGAVFEEEGAGGVAVTIRDMVSYGNDDGETALEVVQEDDGAGSVDVSGGAMAEATEVEGATLSGL